MKTDSGNIFIWDIDDIVKDILSYHYEDVYSEARIVSLCKKWVDISQYYYKRYKSRKVKSRDEFLKICERKSYEYTIGLKPSLISVEVNGVNYELDFGFNSYKVQMNPAFPFITEYRPDHFETPPAILIKQMEVYSKLCKEFPEILEAAIHKARIIETTTKIAYPYILNRIESSGYLDGLKHEVVEEEGSILLRIKNPDTEGREFFEGEVNMDNLDTILEKLPIALSDPENFEFYFPSFEYGCWSIDSK